MSSSTVESQLPLESRGPTNDRSIADNVLLLDRRFLVPLVAGSYSFSCSASMLFVFMGTSMKLARLLGASA